MNLLSRIVRMWRNDAMTLVCHQRWFAFQLSHVIRRASESASDISLPFRPRPKHRERSHLLRHTRTICESLIGPMHSIFLPGFISPICVSAHRIGDYILRMPSDLVGSCRYDLAFPRTEDYQTKSRLLRGLIMGLPVMFRRKHLGIEDNPFLAWPTDFCADFHAIKVVISKLWTNQKRIKIISFPPSVLVLKLLHYCKDNHTGIAA
jgi:hypothetical protein